MNNKIDFIGDIHGHADKLEWLLSKLHYDKKRGVYSHSERKVIFVGDYIDRGPDNPRAISIVRNMVDAGSAIVLCGNHEYNAICFHSKGPEGYLRPHSIKNIKQHSATLLQFHGKQKQYDEAIEWFKTLPLFYETNGFRAVHATWDDASIAYLKSHTKDGIIPEELFYESANKKSDLHHAVEITCKGKEAPLPKGSSFYDKDGTERFDIRLKWWLDPKDKSFQQMSVVEGLDLDNTSYKSADVTYYKESEKPVFFGHYWLKGEPRLYRENICCLDYSVAKKGYLCCYRFNGEKTLKDENFVFV